MMITMTTIIMMMVTREMVMMEMMKIAKMQLAANDGRNDDHDDNKTLRELYR